MKLTQRMIALSSIVLGVLVTACDSPLTAPAESASAIGSARRETICIAPLLPMGGFGIIQCFEWTNPNLGGADTTNNGQTPGDDGSPGGEPNGGGGSAGGPTGGGACLQVSVVCPNGGNSGGSGPWTPRGGGWTPPVPDSVSYDEIVALTNQLADELDQYQAEWSDPFAAIQQESQSSAYAFTPETLFDLVSLISSVRDVVVAGPNAARVAAVVIDAAAVFIPGVPATQSVKIATVGAKEAVQVVNRTRRLLAAARVGRLKHAELSSRLWSTGQIGATRFRTLAPIDGKFVHEIDGAIINRLTNPKTITIVELKPNNPEAVNLGENQLNRYKAALESIDQLTIRNKVTSAVETLNLRDFVILRELGPRIYNAVP